MSTGEVIQCVRSVVALSLLLSASATWAGPLTKAAQEAAEAVVRNFGKEAAQEGVEKLAIRLESLAARSGDDVLQAARKVGPRAIRAVEEAGEHGPQVAKLLSREGTRAAWLLDDSSRLALAARYGDDATEALIKHQGLAQQLISQFGNPAAKALAQLDGQGARRLAMMAEKNELAAIGRTDELLAVVGRFGQKGLDFVWGNKGKLAVGALLTAFLADPQPFIEGTKDLATVAVQEVVAPAAQEAVKQIAPRTDWTSLGVAIVVVLGVYLSVRYYGRHRLQVLRETRR